MTGTPKLISATLKTALSNERANFLFCYKFAFYKCRLTIESTTAKKKDATFITSFTEALACPIERHKKVRPFLDAAFSPVLLSLENCQFSVKNIALATHQYVNYKFVFVLLFVSLFIFNLYKLH
jgi:hypothetical protein